MSVTIRPFGTTKSGEAVSRYTIENGGISASFLDYGCVLQSVLLTDRNGVRRDVVLGYDDLAGYEAGSCFHGSFVGRFANRIAGSRFTLDGTEYRLTPNEGRNHLHGTFGYRVFSAETGENSVIFRYTSPDGEEGYPGTVELTVTCSLDGDGRLTLDYCAETDRPTLLNLTNHSYFKPDDAPTIEQTVLQLNASFFTEGDAETLTTGQILSVKGTPFDFTAPKPIGRDLRDPHPMVSGCKGFDLNLVLDAPSLTEWSARAYSPASGVSIELYTTQPGVQLYTGNFLDTDSAPCGKGGVRVPQYGGFCLESQRFPCGPSYSHFPSCVVRPGTPCHEVTVYRFSVEG